MSSRASAGSLYAFVYFCSANRAPVLSFEPLLNAKRVKLVEAREREQFIPYRVLLQTNCAPYVVYVFVLFRDEALAFFSCLLLVDSPWQLRKNTRFDWVLVVAEEKLVHMVCELLLTHVIDLFACEILFAEPVHKTIKPSRP